MPQFETLTSCNTETHDMKKVEDVIVNLFRRGYYSIILIFLFSIIHILYLTFYYEALNGLNYNFSTKKLALHPTKLQENGNMKI
jgi:hypothetical protein